MNYFIVRGSIFFLALILLTMPFSVSAGTYFDSDVPLILPRSIWENTGDMAKLLDWLPEDKNGNSTADDNPNSNDAIPDYAPVERIVIHDTGCSAKSARCNSDSVDAREIIRSIYRDHAQTRGWGDIGYHYIIDRQGNIYEARFGGDGVRGAHVYDSKNCRNFNVGTVGITLLGNYDYSAVPEPMPAALAQLVGWLAATNGIDAGATAKTTPVWTNLKLNGNGKCDLNYGGFSASFTGPVVLGHNDIELANSDPGKNIDMNRLRQEAKKWQEKYQSYVYRESGTDTIAEIKGGVVKKIAADTQSKIVSINGSQLFLFPEENQTKLVDGTLVKSRNRTEIYLIEGGKRRHITSASLFRKLGFNLGQVRILSDRELMGYAAGEPLIYDDGALLGAKESGKIYLIKNAKKRHVISSKAFKQNNFKEKEVVWVPAEELAGYPDDGIVGLPEGTLISLSHSAKAPNYVVMDGGKKLISSWNMFDLWKFKRNKILVISKNDFDAYPDKGVLGYPDKTVVYQVGQPERYVIYKGNKYWITKYEALAELGLQKVKPVALALKDLESYPAGKQIVSLADWQSILNPVKSVVAKQTLAYLENTATSQAVSVSSGPSIRVGLFEVAADKIVSVTAGGNFKLTLRKIGEKDYQAGQTAEINWNDFGDSEFSAEAGVIFTVSSFHSYNWDKSVDFNRFRGSLELVRSQKTGKIWVVNQLPFEEYLWGIGEALNNDSAEYQKAFALASRSYALFHLQNGGKYGKEEVFHLNSSSSDQVYKGYSWELYAPRLPEAVKVTAGEVMKYNGKPARAVYSSDSGGTTKSACTLWGGEFCGADYGYLSGGIRDPEGTVRRDAATLKASHGVGMSAAGARHLAELGKNYQEILKYYYKDISLEKAY